MKPFSALLVLAFLVPLAAPAAEHGGLQRVDVDLDDKPSLQRGAKLFVNYCMGCHSLRYQRYNRLARDLGLTVEQVRDNLVQGAAKVGDTMDVAMRAEDSAKWFGVTPPDLSLIARSRGPDWLYSYLLGFYADPDPARPFGVNNLVFKDVAMPNALWRLQGVQRPVRAEDGTIERLELAEPGEMEPGEFRAAMRDLVNFLVYVGEPAQLVRARIGPWVLLFLLIFLLLSRALYKEYWRDVH